MPISHSYCYWNFNHEASYLPDVTCNIVVKAHFGRSRFQMQHSTQSDIPPQISQKNWTRWDMRSSTPDKQSVIPPNLWSRWSDRDQMSDGLYPARLSDIPTQFLTLTSSFSGLAISHCYWHLVVKNSNCTLLMTSSGQEWQLHIATDI